MACATFDSSRAPNISTRSVVCSRKAASCAPLSLRSQVRSKPLTFPSLLQQVARLISLNASPYFACRSSSSRARVDLLMSELICFGLVGALVCSAAVGPRSAVNTRHVACAAGALLWSSGVRIAQARRSAIPAEGRPVRCWGKSRQRQFTDGLIHRRFTIQRGHTHAQGTDLNLGPLQDIANIFLAIKGVVGKIYCAIL